MRRHPRGTEAWCADVPWAGVERFLGTGTRLAAGCACRAALRGAARAGVSVPMYSVTHVAEEDRYVVVVREWRPVGEQPTDAPPPWLCSCLSAAAVRLEVLREEPAAAMGQRHHFPSLRLGPWLRELVSRGDGGVRDTHLEGAVGITPLDDVAASPPLTSAG
jgi:hypothetical protein